VDLSDRLVSVLGSVGGQACGRGCPVRHVELQIDVLKVFRDGSRTAGELYGDRCVGSAGCDECEHPELAGSERADADRLVKRAQPRDRVDLL